MMLNKDTVVINRLFAGEYLETHLGHEIINLFQADNGTHYLYLNPYGSFAKVHSGHISTMLLVKKAGNGLVQVTAMAQGLHPAPGVDEIIDGDEQEIISEQEQYIKNQCGGITYNGKSVIDIFHNEPQAIYVTFKADAVYVPMDGKRIFIKYANGNTAGINICSNDVIVDFEGYNFPSQSLKSFIYPQGTYPGDSYADNIALKQKDYTKLVNQVVSNSNLWTAQRKWKIKNVVSSFSKADDIVKLKESQFDLYGDHSRYDCDKECQRALEIFGQRIF